MKPFKRIHLTDATLNRFQDNVSEAVNPLTQLPIVDGVLLGEIDLTSGASNEVPHKLQRMPRLWFLADIDAEATVWRTSWNTNNITLQTSADCTIKLWIA